MYLLDTNVISETIAPRPEPRVIAWFSTVAQEELFIPVVAKAELLFGVLVLPSGRRREALSAMIDAWFEPYEGGAILPFTTREARTYAAIVADRRAHGRPVRELDAQIAAIAATQNLAVVTRNVADFDGCGVPVINPWEANR
jgi:predicted nucleic acid-binding protein